jgi:hypothetical protein
MGYVPEISSTISAKLKQRSRQENPISPNIEVLPWIDPYKAGRVVDTRSLSLDAIKLHH